MSDQTELYENLEHLAGFNPNLDTPRAEPAQRTAANAFPARELLWESLDLDVPFCEGGRLA